MSTQLSPKQPRYLSQTRTAYYGFLLTIPLFLIYELGTMIQGGEIRNAAEAWILILLYKIFDSFTLLAVAVLYIGTFVVIVWIRSGDQNRTKFQRGYVLPAIGEAFVYSWILAPIISLMMVNGGVGDAVVTSCGAGFFEELFFRVILFGGLLALIVHFFQLKKSRTKMILIAIAVSLISSFLFSLVHYIGSLADQFTLSSFMFRFLAGMTFCILYFARGFAITAWTHALYDVWILSGLYGVVLG